MAVYSLGEQIPDIHPTAWVHPSAVVIGSVVLGEQASIWPGAVLRGDFGPIEVGARTCIQDNVTIHADSDGTVIGAECVVGHAAHIEGAQIEGATLIGVRSIVLRARICTGAVVAAGALLLDGFEVPPGQRAQGVPARLAPSAMSVAEIRAGAAAYVTMAARHRSETAEI